MLKLGGALLLGSGIWFFGAGMMIAYRSEFPIVLRLIGGGLSVVGGIAFWWGSRLGKRYQSEENANRSRGRPDKLP